MTETEAVSAAPAAAIPERSSGLRKMLLFGTGLGISVAGNNLELAIVRARPSGARLVAATTVVNFRLRPAAEWGAEISSFLAAASEQKLPATLVLPRAETIVRSVHLPGVSAKELPAAIELQTDTLHPYGDEEVAWAFTQVGGGSVLVGLVRKTVLDGYETLFDEAGIPVAAVTFSAAVLYPSLRLWTADSKAVLSYHVTESSERPRVEIYGESEARPVYSAEFPLPLERALSVARGELRLVPETPVRTVAEILPKPTGTENLAVSALAYAAAVCGAVPRASRLANLLPAERRASQSRWQWMIPTAIAVLLACLAVAVFVVFPAMDQQRYARELAAEARKLEPASNRVRTLEAQAAANRARTIALDQFRSRPQADLDVLNELSRILPQNVWTSSIEIFPDSVVLVGEAEQAAPLLKLLDSSPLFENSEFGLSVVRNQASEQFRIKTLRRGRIGRTTP